MVLKLYNTLGRKKQVFKPIVAGKVSMYSCGLTVYNYGHIGNYRAFVAADILRRYLEFSGYVVKKVVNITDVDDKTIRESVKQGMSLKKYTKKYEEAFFADEQALAIKPAMIYPCATEHIVEMVKLIQQLLAKGIAYASEDGIYFNIRKFKRYGKLSGIDVKKLLAGKSERVGTDEYDKDNVQDFALWKFYDVKDGDVFWDVAIGKGRPGWHIECSAMSSKYLGQPFDIHTGGIDLVFPHHENEIAQSQGCNDKPLANYWVHNEWMMVEGKKMSKSLGNYYTVRDVVSQGFDPLSLRYFYLTGQYRTQLNFTLENLKHAQNSLLRLRTIFSDLIDDGKENKLYLKKFEQAMDDDLDTVRGLQVLWELVRDESATGKVHTIQKIDSVLGLGLTIAGEIKIPAAITQLVAKREAARKAKQWDEADRLRDLIIKKGFKLADSSEGVKISKI